MDFRNYNKRDVHMHTLLGNTNGFYFVTHFPNFVGKCEKNCFIFYFAMLGSSDRAGKSSRICKSSLQKIFWSFSCFILKAFLLLSFLSFEFFYFKALYLFFLLSFLDPSCLPASFF